MKNKKSKPNLSIVIILIISLGILLPTANVFSQNLLSINEDIGGNNGTTQQGNKSDNTTLIVVGVIVIGGIIAYSFLKKDKEKTDSTDNNDKSALLMRESNSGSFNSEIQKTKDKIPVDIILGMRKEKAFISERTYILGVSVRF